MINETLDKYFDAVTHKDIEAVLAVFDENAVISTSGGEFRGREAIARFYEEGVFKCISFHPLPGPRHVWDNQVALEIELDCDGIIKKVGDFFTIDEGKITKMTVYSGPGYVPTNLVNHIYFRNSA